MSTLLYSQDDEMLHAELSKRWCNTLQDFNVSQRMIIKSVADVRRVPQNWHNKHDATLQRTVK